MMRTLMFHCHECRDTAQLEVEADRNDGPGDCGICYYLPEVVCCPDCGTDCTAAAQRATGHVPSAADLADMRYGV